MANYWKTGNSLAKVKTVTRPSVGQIVWQLGLAVLIVAIWSGLLAGYLWVTGEPAGEVVSPAPATEPAVAAAAPTEPPTATRMPRPTDPPLPTETPAEVATPLEEATTEPAPAPTDTPTPEPTPTEPAASPTGEPAPAAAEPGQVSFSQDVLPILEQRCFKCHGGQDENGEIRTEEGLTLTNYDDIMAGSWNGPVIEPGNVEDSFLIEQITTGEMPKKEPHLLPAQIRAITDWVAAGAPNN